MHPVSSSLLSKKVNQNDPTDRRRTWAVFSLVSILSLLLLLLFLDTRHKSTTLTYENLYVASFDDAEMPEGFTSDAEHRYDGQSGYLYFGSLNQKVTTPALTTHSDYRLYFRVALLNVASPETYNESIPTFTLRAYASDARVIDEAVFYHPEASLTYEAEFHQANAVAYFTLSFTNYAGINGYQAYAGIDDLTLQTPKEG